MYRPPHTFDNEMEEEEEGCFADFEHDNNVVPMRLGYSDLLVIGQYPSLFDQDAIRNLKATFRLEQSSAESVALVFVRMVKNWSPETAVPESVVVSFLATVLEQGANENVKKKAALVLSSFYHFLETAGRSLGKYGTPKSGYRWTGHELSSFNVIFQDCQQHEFVDSAPLTEELTQFIEKNNFITFDFFYSDDIPNPEQQTRFSSLLDFMVKTPSNVSTVQRSGADLYLDNEADYMRELLAVAFSGHKFLVKQRFPMKLKMTLRGGASPKEATADVIVMRIRETAPEYEIGLVVVEDKAYEYTTDVDVYAAAEAQMVAEGIAVAQGPTWNMTNTCYMLRVVGNTITFYRTIFSTEFLKDVENGARRSTPFVIHRHAPLRRGEQGLGYNIFVPAHRAKVVEILGSIAQKLS